MMKVVSLFDKPFINLDLHVNFPMVYMRLIYIQVNETQLSLSLFTDEG